MHGASLPLPAAAALFYGRLFTIEQMVAEMGFHAVFIGTGAGYPSFMGIPGESLNGVLSANELLGKLTELDNPSEARRERIYWLTNFISRWDAADREEEPADIPNRGQPTTGRDC